MAFNQSLLSFDVLNTNNVKTLSFDFPMYKKYRENKLLNFSGIYVIECIKNNKIYIGSAKNFSKRFSWHKTALIKNKHYNTKLQNAFNKYGVENFTFKIVRVSPIKERNFLIKEEQKYIDKYFPNNDFLRKNGFNLKRNADGGFLGGKKLKFRKAVSVFDLNMNFIEEIVGINEASKKYNAKVSSCCLGKLMTSGGYIFRHSDNIFLNREKKQDGMPKGYKTKKARAVYQYSALTGDFIKEWRCFTDIPSEIGYSASYIIGHINNRYPRVGDFVFKREKFEKILPVKIKVKRQPKNKPSGI